MIDICDYNLLNVYYDIMLNRSMEIDFYPAEEKLVMCMIDNNEYGLEYTYGFYPTNVTQLKDTFFQWNIIEEFTKMPDVIKVGNSVSVSEGGEAGEATWEGIVYEYSPFIKFNLTANFTVLDEECEPFNCSNHGDCINNECQCFPGWGPIGICDVNYPTECINNQKHDPTYNCTKCLQQWNNFPDCDTCSDNVGPPGICTECNEGFSQGDYPLCMKCALYDDYMRIVPYGTCDVCHTGFANYPLCDKCSTNVGPENRCFKCITGVSIESFPECDICEDGYTRVGSKCKKGNGLLSTGDLISISVSIVVVLIIVVGVIVFVVVFIVRQQKGDNRDGRSGASSGHRLGGRRRDAEMDIPLRNVSLPQQSINENGKNSKDTGDSIVIEIE